MAETSPPKKRFIIAKHFKPKSVIPSDSTRKKCPVCGEEILKVALKCKHCGEFIHKSNASIPSVVASPEHKGGVLVLIASVTCLFLSWICDGTTYARYVSNGSKSTGLSVETYQRLAGALHESTPASVPGILFALFALLFAVMGLVNGRIFIGIFLALLSLFSLVMAF